VVGDTIFSRYDTTSLWNQFMAMLRGIFVTSGTDYPVDTELNFIKILLNFNYYSTMI